jgi:4-amino-4-deoxy-L-arabinose transferase-like glycosyltransferase
MTCPESIEQPLKEDVCSVPSRFWTWVILLLILLLAASLRLYKLGQISPPGLNQDEAVNAWNAWCLLKTGKDQVGVSWPIFYLRTLGSNNTPLYIYLMIPFFAVFGFSIWSVRLVSAVFGILCIPVIYYTGYRLFDRRVGLMAALLLALNPWHLYINRVAYDSGICPLLGIVPLAAMLWAGMPVSDDEKYVPRPLIAVFAGAATGISCYGYWAARIFIPAFLGLAVLISIPALWASAKTRKGLLAIAVFGVVFFAFFGPLVWQHIFHSEGIARHGYDKSWLGPEPLPAAIKNVVIHYIKHFSPIFLFMRSDIRSIQFPPRLFHWYMFPIMFLGLIVLVRNFSSSRSARTLLAFVLAYPVGDLFIQPIAFLTPLRSSPGLCGLILLAAVGAVDAGKWIWQKNRKTALSVFLAFAAVVVGLNAKYLHYFYGEYNRRPAVYHFNHADLAEACRWLKPRFDEFDAILCTTTFLNMPYVVTLVALDYDPHRWFSEERTWFTDVEFDYYTRYGKMYFMYPPAASQMLKSLPRKARILFIVRPGELGLKNPIHQIYRPYDGEPALWMCQP